MKRIKLLSVFITILIITASCFLPNKLDKSSTTIRPLSDNQVIRDGSLVYALPRSIFTIKVEFERIINIPGPYAKYAEELLGLSNVITSEEEIWSVKSISVNTHEEADPSEYYVIESNTLIQSNALALKKEGLILDLNPESYSRVKSLTDSKEVDINQFRSYDLGSDEYYKVRADTVYRRVSVDKQYIRIPYIVEQKAKLSDAQLAERAAKRLMDLRDGKFMILTGEANVFPQSEDAINEINKMEAGLTELFAGRTFKDTRTFTYHITPGKEMTAGPVELFKFSEVTGPGEVDAANGIPVVMELYPEQKTKDLSLITRARPDPAVPVQDKLFYRIPDVVNVTISMEGETLYQSRKLVYQFGAILQLPANYAIVK